MTKTRRDGSPLTPNDLEFRNQSYVSGLARPASGTRQPEGTTTTPAGILLQYVTVRSAAEQKAVGGEGWADLPATLAQA
jgi:hypothetical protein